MKCFKVPLLSNIYICNLFYDTDHQDIARYIDDIIPYASTKYIFIWFLSNRQIITTSKAKMEVAISNCLIKNKERVF